MLNVDGLTVNIIRTLKTDFPHVRISTTQRNTVRSLLPVIKDPVMPADRSNVVYNIPCAGPPDRDEDCPMCYVGQTSYKLRTRMSKHKSDITTLNKMKAAGASATDPAIRELRKSAVVDHCYTQEHMFDFEKAAILDSSNKHRRHLEVLEMCHIQNTPNTTNVQNDTDGRAVSYGGVFHTLTNTNRRRTTIDSISYRERSNQNRQQIISASEV